MKIISKITIDCVEYEDLVYYRWKENDWYLQGSMDLLQLTMGEEVGLEKLFQEAKRKQRLEDADIDLDDLILCVNRDKASEVE